MNELANKLGGLIADGRKKQMCLLHELCIVVVIITEGEELVGGYSPRPPRMQNIEIPGNCSLLQFAPKEKDLYVQRLLTQHGWSQHTKLEVDAFHMEIKLESVWTDILS